MIGNCKLDPQQMNDRTDQPFGLAPRSAKHCAQDQSRLDCHIRE
jgi:hypothetical protein